MTENLNIQPRAPRTPSALGVITAVAVVALVIASVALYASRQGSSSHADARTVSVTGSGTATGIPDTVTFQLGVNTVRTNAADALKVNNIRVRSLTAALKAQGVTQRNIQTSNLNIYQMTDQSGAPTGFTVSDSLQVTMHDLKRAGSAIDAAVAAVGNGVNFDGVSFSQSNQSSALAQARAKAMSAARTAAGELATASGLHLGAPLKIVDQENQISEPPYPMYGAFATSAKVANTTSLSPGTQSVSVQVSVTYQMTP